MMHSTGALITSMVVLMDWKVEDSIHSTLEETTTTVDQKYDNEFPIHVTNKPYKLQQHSSL